MFRAKTVLVIGAGASVEVGLPMGSELLKQIIEITDIKFEHYRQVQGDRLVVDALRSILKEDGDVAKLNAHLQAGWQLAKSAKQALSIDNVIDVLEDPCVELMGKLGIVRAILTAESRSQRFRCVDDVPDTMYLNNFDETWYSSFTKVLTENVKKSQIDRIFENLQIINFNYDRCIEHYLPYSISQYYGVDVEYAREIMASLPIHRPYGIVGQLPWQGGAAPGVSFGMGGSHHLGDVVQQVRTFTERVEEGTELAAIKGAISGADRIIFLGFAFHRQNVELLAAKTKSNVEILGTAFGISTNDRSVIEDELQDKLKVRSVVGGRNISLPDMKCDKLFKEYWRTITAGPGDSQSIDLPVRPATGDPFAGIFANG